MVNPVSGPKMQTAGPVDRSDVIMTSLTKAVVPGIVGATAYPGIYNLVGGRTEAVYIAETQAKAARLQFYEDLDQILKSQDDLAGKVRATPTNTVLATQYAEGAEKLQALRTGNLAQTVKQFESAETTAIRTTSREALAALAPKGREAIAMAERDAGKALRRSAGATAKWGGILGTAVISGLSAHENYSAYQTGLKSGGRAGADFATDVVIGGTCAAMGATIGAYIGTGLMFPGVGTLIGAGVGAGIGFGIDYALSDARDVAFNKLGFY
ncbi:MAG: hypothetical protein A3G32_06390 [Deltaproteobacteria bacterium RIFCSPLOWO2_12_FULL_40_28]|nr:MAG: hypothetical protein A3C45_02485 [Deltaproteobacteria bacterium RIFCSPHIGHO2_02_FULL_40_28]OGQ19080.1 MAG: hypothetical protein A3E27_05575 [Deltaproteobacteria bacterium RIFCSPHIGHO2_12_FULL_40_32]OGQ40252.1 MAG: hypothetical protein A3I69_01015 [Deltaproteobacteria bacterium RIFCSPLOWO2_02_FULL_40_36]OGQ53523.1 MAG: hypothetical protein A3G32_06390 [Deltaproteobacteria bacterium RIFCSPLOWO2_12_FULL_40_28]